MTHPGSLTRPVALALALAVSTPFTATAQDSEMREGMDLLSEGTKLLLRGLMSELEPTFEDLEGALEGLDGALSDLSAYHAPEVLPNGDIIIRRKVPLQVDPEVGEDGEVEL